MNHEESYRGFFNPQSYGKKTGNLAFPFKKTLKNRSKQK